MSGRALAEQLAVLWPTLKVLFMSGYTATTIAKNYQLLPESAFLHKPFTPTILAQKVRMVLDT
jgi:two-component system cell cycle sensor histidine kinase/response regulator CckA